MTKSNAKGTWVKGQSGNPGGRPKLSADLKVRIRDLGARAVDALERALDSDDPRVVVLAAKELLDRGYGKPAQVLDATLRGADMGESHLAALKALNASRVVLRSGSDDSNSAPN